MCHYPLADDMGVVGLQVASVLCLEGDVAWRRRGYDKGLRLIVVQPRCAVW